jgi:hypothetical protein
VTTRPGIPRFRGSFNTFRVTYNEDRENGTADYLLVFSQGKRVKVHRYLWLKFLWNELTKDEWFLFISMPETLNSNLIYNSIRAINLKGKKWVRNRLIDSPFLDSKDIPTKDKYRGYQGLKVEIHFENRRLPKVPKFSGYVKSSSQVGSKRSRKSSFLDLIIATGEDYSEVVFDWFAYLTVGESYTFLPGKIVKTP